MTCGFDTPKKVICMRTRQIHDDQKCMSVSRSILEKYEDLCSDEAESLMIFWHSP